MRGMASSRFHVTGRPVSLRSSEYPLLSLIENKSKNRRGPIPTKGSNGILTRKSGTVNLAFLKKFTRFENLAMCKVVGNGRF